MKNPFSYSGIVTDKAFCNRVSEIGEIRSLVENSQNILLFSHRKTGKSSLIFKLFKEIKKNNSDVKTIYIDLYGTLSEQDFVDALFTGLTQIEPQYKKILKTIPGLKIVSSLDPLTGMPAVSISSEPAEKKNLLAQVMKTLESYSKKSKLVVAFDEFQEISEYTEEGFEKRLRSFIQMHENISYLFSGSQAHLLSEMFLSAKRPFYHSAQSFPLQPIEKEDYISWAKGLFKEKNVDLPEDIMDDIVERCDYQPLYIQQFLYKLWQARVIDFDKVSEIEHEIINSHKNEYISVFDNLTVNQKKALKLLVKTGGASVYQTENLSSVGLKNASLLARAIQSLLDKELISKNGTYRIQDVMFKKWILAIL